MFGLAVLALPNIANRPSRGRKTIADEGVGLAVLASPNIAKHRQRQVGLFGIANPCSTKRGLDDEFSIGN
jgi:hypothetical protein